MAKTKSDLRDSFNQQLDNLMDNSRAVGEGFTGEQQRLNYLPNAKNEGGTWEGDPHDLVNLSEAFSREANGEDVATAVTDDGTITDLMVSAMQGDYLACAERAYRATTMTSVRRRMHAAGRKIGHGDVRGLFERGVRGYLAGLLKQGKN